MDGDDETRRARVASLAGGDEELALLVDALGDDNWRVRKEAALRVATWEQPERAARVLVDVLSPSDNVGRRNAAVEGLWRLGAVALAPLFDALGKAPEHRKLIVDTLGMIGDRRAVAPLIPSLADRDANVRAAAAEALGRLGGPEAELALSRALETGEVLLSLACLEALNSLGAAISPGRLLPLMATPVLQPATVTALGHSRSAEAAATLLARLSDRSRAVREAAILALARLYRFLEGDERSGTGHRAALVQAGDNAEPLLVQALLEGGSDTRRAAATLLGLTGRPSAVRPLVLALSDEDTREPAFQALVRIGPAAYDALITGAARETVLRPALFRALPDLPVPESGGPRDRLLVTALADEDTESAGEAARALGEVGGEAALAPLLDALEREDVAAQVQGALERIAARLPLATRSAVLARGFNGPSGGRRCRVLGACRSADDLPALLRLLGDGEPAVRAAAADALALLSTADGVDRASIERALVETLKDGAADVRAAAICALCDAASEDVSQALAAAAADREPQVRAAAVRCLAGRSDAAARTALAERAMLEQDPVVRAALVAALSLPSGA